MLGIYRARPLSIPTLHHQVSQPLKRRGQPLLLADLLPQNDALFKPGLCILDVSQV